MVLAVVIRLIGIIVHIPIFIIVLPCPVVRAVLGILVQVYSIPGDAAFLVSHQIGKAEGALTAQPAQHRENRLGVHLCIADIAVRPAQIARRAHVKAAGKKAGREGDRCDAGHIRSSAQFHRPGGLASHKGGVHIDAGSEGTGSVGRCAQSPLHLDGRKQVGQGRDVHPEDLLAFGIIERDTVQRDVDLGSLGASDGHGRIAQARTAFVVGYHGRQQVQGHGQRIHGIGLSQFRFSQAGVSNGSLFAGTGGRYDDRVQTLGLFLRLCAEGQRAQHRQKQSFFHFPYDGINRIKFKGSFSIRDFRIPPIFI